MNEQLSTHTPIPSAEETLHPDVVAFCALLARIMHRCLKEQDPRIMALLKEAQLVAPVPESEVSHAA
jgi:hypothetical protein